jgi:tRNA pseudouridine13 synthase
MDDKSQRGQVHQWIREAFYGKLDTMSNEEGCIQVMVKGSGPKNRFAKKQRSELEYCLFHLYKENMESQNALSLIARTLK